MIRTVAEFAEREGPTLVVKLHPKEATGESPPGFPYRRLSERQMKADPALAALMTRGAFVLDADNVLDTDQLSAGADACVAVNSQAGLEALVRGTEVVLCGNAFYGGLGFTHEAEDPGSLEVALTRALDGNSRRNVGAEAKRFFVTYLEGLCQPKTVGIMGALCATPGAEASPEAATAEPARTAPNAAAADAAPSRAEREAYGSGERQTAVQFESIRADHRARYDYAAEWLTAELARARRGDGPLLGIDAFCGNGYGAARLARAPHVCVQGIDASEDAIAVAQSHFGSERVQFQALRFPCDLPKERFDFATCFESLEHVEEDGALLETLARSLAPGGLLFVSVPNEETLPIAHNAAFFKFHVRHYRTEQLVELAASKGLALRARTGQHAYRTAGPRAVEPLSEDRMGLDPAIPDPHFMVLAFEKITPESVAASGPADALRLDLGCGERAQAGLRGGRHPSPPGHPARHRHVRPGPAVRAELRPAALQPSRLRAPQLRGRRAWTSATTSRSSCPPRRGGCSPASGAGSETGAAQVRLRHAHPGRRHPLPHRAVPRGGPHRSLRGEPGVDRVQRAQQPWGPISPHGRERPMGLAA